MNRFIPNNISTNLSNLFKSKCPSIVYQSPFLDNYLTKNDDELIKIGFISNNLHNTNSKLFYQTNNLIKYLPKDKYQVYLLVFEHFDIDPNLDAYQIVLLNNNLENTKNIIINLELDILSYLDLGAGECE